MSEFAVKHSISGGGGKAPMAKELKAILKNVPDEATVTLTTHDSQRDGYSWSLTAEWDDAVQDAWKPPYGHHKPGFRGGVSGTVPRDYEGVGGMGSQDR